MNAARLVEVLVPGATSGDIRIWANNIAEANPITSDPTDFTPTVNLDVTDYPFMGVELRLQSEKQHLLTLVLFAQIPNEKERETMEADGVTVGGL
ncbi:hypothetical protein SEA_SALLYK_68 [Microbacterium phage SallyK]|uniref:Uncharacterized protein n=1 Tax=Microbacterium phage Hyperion TaxID=2182354 RepID=A0A2U8UJ51_9CAUD|nr:hypothetical protein HOT27_gp066 [Microbacterium phage Hyperion]QWY80150.1 hypothetical protein SEA_STRAWBERRYJAMM_71 [Microbacterium phage StrawberryJamm]UJD20797.1 hypothetical protein SEA_ALUMINUMJESUS_62 [Microbacterium phage AluminumJesus]UVG34434.1 hypothetical protein SEA_GAZEBO_65 [Microbacterium phage Gazebo]WKW84934.1 hypothetical protein SEA_SALLYK_68 [Microbacterium phage SallyK]AWN03581.1 hypothetical protein PBI_HYPERION_66 [Microbacterium phage Hyperion]